MHSVDPLEFFPPEISELIFERLSAKNLLTASLVNTSWHQYITKSKTLMNKIKFIFCCKRDREFFEDIVGAVLGSERVYENLEVESCSYCLEKILPFLSLHNWKSVKILRSSFINSEQASNFFSKIHSTVEVLDISEVYVKNAYTAGKNKDLKYPKLKVLRTKNIQSLLYYDIFANIKTLEEFSACSNSQNVASLNTILEILKVNKNLKTLEISGRLLHQIFYDDITKYIQFKLSEILIANQNYCDEAYQDRVYDHFLKFIKAQKNLTSITIDKWMGTNVLKAILEHPIKKLRITSDIPLQSVESCNGVDLRANLTIIDLTIEALSFRIETTKKIIGNFPNLEHLTCSYADEKLIEFLDNKTRKLKSLRIDLLNVKNLTKFKIFKTVKILKIANYLKSMEGRLNNL